jgi:hypothetical protein
MISESYADIVITSRRKVKRRCGRQTTRDNDYLPVKAAEEPEQWVKVTKPRPIVGKTDEFTSTAIKSFASGDIDRAELMFRLRFGYASSKNRNRSDR